jgi:hypothetical protein
MTAPVLTTADYAPDRANNWAAFASTTAPLPSYRENWDKRSHGWKVPIEFCQPIGLDYPGFMAPIQPLIDELAKMEEIELFPEGHLYMTTVHVGFLKADDIMWSQVESIYVNAAPRLHRLDPFPLKIGGISATEDALYFGVDDGDIVKEIRRMVRLAVPVVYQKARDDTRWGEFIPSIRFAGFTGKGSRQRVVQAVSPYLDAHLADVTVDKVKMARIPADPQTGWGDLDVIAEIGLYGKAARQGYHT